MRTRVGWLEDSLLQDPARYRYTQVWDHGVVGVDDQQTTVGTDFHVVGIEGDGRLVPVTLRSAFPDQVQCRYIGAQGRAKIGAVLLVDHQGLGESGEQARILPNLRDWNRAEIHGIGERVDPLIQIRVRADLQRGLRPARRRDRDWLRLSLARAIRLERPR